MMGKKKEGENSTAKIFEKNTWVVGVEWCLYEVLNLSTCPEGLHYNLICSKSYPIRGSNTIV